MDKLRMQPVIERWGTGGCDPLKVAESGPAESDNKMPTVYIRSRLLHLSHMRISAGGSLRLYFKLDAMRTEWRGMVTGLFPEELIKKESKSLPPLPFLLLYTNSQPPRFSKAHQDALVVSDLRCKLIHIIVQWPHGNGGKMWFESPAPLFTGQLLVLFSLTFDSSVASPLVFPFCSSQEISKMISQQN